MRVFPPRGRFWRCERRRGVSVPILLRSLFVIILSIRRLPRARLTFIRSIAGLKSALVIDAACDPPSTTAVS